MQMLRRLWNDDNGQDVAEYAIILGLIAVVVVAAVTLIGTNANTVFGKISTALSGI